MELNISTRVIDKNIFSNEKVNQIQNCWCT
jgi:hypothetical protein